VYDFGDDTGMRGLANKLGLQYVGRADHEVFLDETGGLADLPLLGMVNPDDVTDLMFGRLNDTNVQLFNAELPGFAPDPRFPRRSCVVLTFVAGFPTIVLAPQTPMSKLRTAKLFHTIPAAFRDRFDIQTKQPEDAELVLGPALTGWLTDQHTDLRFEISGGALMGHIPQVPDTEYLDLVDLVQEFHAHIPDEAWNRFSLFGNL
jgi:hypothetical protein